MPCASDPNRCSASERAIINTDRRPTARADRGRGSRGPGRSVLGKRTLADEAKLDIFQHSSAWVISGQRKTDSPIPMLCETYACNSQCPKRLYDKVMGHGSRQQPVLGRAPPGVFREGVGPDDRHHPRAARAAEAGLGGSDRRSAREESARQEDPNPKSGKAATGVNDSCLPKPI